MTGGCKRMMFTRRQNTITLRNTKSTNVVVECTLATYIQIELNYITRKPRINSSVSERLKQGSFVHASFDIFGLSKPHARIQWFVIFSLTAKSCESKPRA